MATESPEEAARGGLREEYVRVIGVVVRGNEAIVAQVMNADSYPVAYETETATCSRMDEGWTLGSSSNGNVSWIETAEGRRTVVWWDEAAVSASAARIRLGQCEQTLPVEDGFVFAVFDDVPEAELLPSVKWVGDAT